MKRRRESEATSRRTIDMKFSGGVCHIEATAEDLRRLGATLIAFAAAKDQGVKQSGEFVFRKRAA